MCRHGENIYKRKDGRYEGRFVIGRNDQGRTRFGYVYGQSYGAVRQELLRRKASLWESETATARSGLTLNAWMERYLFGERMAHLKPRSREMYRGTYDRHIAAFLGRVDLGRITALDVNQLIDILIRKKLAQSTISGVLRLLCAALQEAKEDGLISYNPCSRINLPLPPREEQRVLSVTEQESLQAAAIQQKNFAALLALYTGLRLGEICALSWQDIDFQQGMLHVRSTAQRLQTKEGEQKTAVILGPPKSSKSRRSIPLPAFLRDQLRFFRESVQSVYVLGSGSQPADPRTIQRRFTKVVQSAGLDGVHFHTLRHTFATRMLELGVDVKTVSVLLGHSSTRITLEFYAHSLLDQQRAAMEKLAVFSLSRQSRH